MFIQTINKHLTNQTNLTAIDTLVSGIYRILHEWAT